MAIVISFMIFISPLLSVYAENSIEQPLQETVTEQADSDLFSENAIDTLTQESTPSDTEDDLLPEGNYDAATFYEITGEAFVLNELTNLSIGMQFWNNESSGWENIPGQAPGDGLYRIVLEYEMYMSDLLASGGHLLYQIPDHLKGVQGSGNIFDGDVLIGQLTVDRDTVSIDYDLSRINLSATSFHGSNFLNVRIDTEEIPEDGKLDILEGDIHIIIQLEPDSFYKYAGVSIDKCVSPEIRYDEEGQYYYLEYTLTLTAENHLSKAVVIDEFLVNADYVHSYVGLTSTETDVFVEQSGTARNTVYCGKKNSEYTTAPEGQEMPPGVLVWMAYDMEKGEVRELTYKVRLKDEFAEELNAQSYSNRASAYSGSKHEDHPNIYLQDKDESVFETQVDVKLEKTNSTVHTDEEGNEYAEYTVTITAPETNSYTLKQLVLHDWFGSDTKNKLVYDWTSFTLDGSPCTAVPGEESWGNCAEVTIDHLAPGQTMILKYRVWIKPESYLSYSGSTHFDNSVQTVINGVWLPNKVVARLEPIGKRWMAKSVDAVPVQAEQVIEMDGVVWDAVGTVSGIRQFAVPAGSYRYQVIVNEDGGWDVSKATFQDAFVANMQNVGFVKVEAVDVSQPEPAAAMTVWLKIDGNAGFCFKPADLGFPEGNYAYYLTYYAKPMMNITMTAKNTFTLSGSVGRGGYGYYLNIPGVSVDLPLVGEQKCTMKKQSWYYTSPEEKANYYDNRVTEYWVARASGNLVQGMMFKDLPVSNTSIMPDSVAGLYVGPADLEFNGYGLCMEDLQEQQKQQMIGITSLEKDVDYISENGTVTLLRPVILAPDQELFIIYRTRLNFGIEGYGPTAYFTIWNNVNYSYDGGISWNQGAQAAQIISNSKGMSKSDGTMYTYNGSKWSELNSGKSASLPTTAALTPGLYVSWLVKINQVGSTKGKATIIDSLPAGTSLAYVSLNSIGTWLDYNEPGKAVPEQEFLEGLDYVLLPMENEGVYLARNPRNPYVMEGENIYYDQNQNKVIWSVDNLRIQDNKACENYYLVFRVMCRVENADFRSEDEISFKNNATVVSALGRQDISNTVRFQVSTLKKSGDRDYALSSGTYPFIIDANPKGLDLDPDHDTIVLVDEMNAALSFQSETLEIINTVTGNALDPGLYRVTYTSRDDKSVLEFVLPDEMALTIRYNTRVTVPPESKVAVKNTAYWKGYLNKGDSVVEDPNFQYEVGGSGSAYSTYGTLKITKKSASNLAGPSLPGAVYGIYPVTVDRLNKPQLGNILTGKAKEDQGIYTYDYLLYNTIYCVKELVAPEGYLIDETPYYVAIADSRDTTKYQELLADIEKLRSSGILVDGQFFSDTHEIMRVDQLDMSYTLSVHKVDGSDESPLEGVGFTIYEEVSESTPGAKLICTTDGKLYGKPLGEEVFTKLDEDGTASADFFHLQGDGLHKYYLAETTGLVGYLTMNSAIPIQVEAVQYSDGSLHWNAYVKSLKADMNGNHLTIELKNYAKLDMPVSGVIISDHTFLVTGMVMIALAVVLLLLLLRKQEEYKKFISEGKV